MGMEQKSIDLRAADNARYLALSATLLLRLKVQANDSKSH